MNALNEFIIILYIVFGGCCSTTFTMESIIKIQKNCGNIILLFQFSFITLEGLINNLKFNNKKKKFPLSLKSRKVPLHKWYIMVILFFSSSVLNNLVFKYNISMPIHIIFRSSSIIVNIIMSRLILKKRYTLKQILSVLIVTIGLIITTLNSAKNKNKISEGKVSFNDWIKGIIILIISTIIGSLMGIYQEYIFKKYPNSWKECLFYKHLLSLPIFIFLIPQIKEQWKLFQMTPKNPLNYYISFINMPSFISNIKVQGIWIYVILNIITQYICISSIQKLSSICSSVTLNLILSIRKFTSLIISIILFKNVFPLWSWAGSILVFTGVILYARTSDKLKREKKLKNENSIIQKVEL